MLEGGSRVRGYPNGARPLSVELSPERMRTDPLSFGTLTGAGSGTSA
jgi:hypothetical protein